MRLTEAQIRRIIKEELMNVLEIQDVSVGKKSFLSQNEKQPEVLATFKVKDVLSIFAGPKSDADIDKLKPLRDFIFNFKNYANQLSADQRQMLFKKEAKIVKKGSGNIYQYWMVMPHITEEGFKEVPIGKEAELAAFENLTGIKLNKQVSPQSSTVAEPSSRELPSRGAEMSAFANQLQGGTHGLAKGMRENKRIIKKQLVEVLQGTQSPAQIFTFILQKYQSYVPLFKEQPKNVESLKNSLKDLLQSPQNGVKSIIAIEPPIIQNGMIYGSFVELVATDGKRYKFNYAPSVSTLVDMQTNQIVYRN